MECRLGYITLEGERDNVRAAMPLNQQCNSTILHPDVIELELDPVIL